MTSTEKVIGWWKEHFEERLILTNPTSIVEAELEDDGGSSFISPILDLEKVYDRVPWEILREVLRGYRVRVSLLSVRVLCSKLDSFPVGVGLHQGCALSPILFVIFIDRISRRSRGGEGLQFGELRIASPSFADDVVLMAPTACDLQHSLDRFAAECEAAGMRISTSNSEFMVLSSRKPLD